MEGGLKSGNFIFRGILITAVSQFPMYLEWAKASLKTILLQNTREQLLLEVTTT